MSFALCTGETYARGGGGEPTVAVAAVFMKEKKLDIVLLERRSQ